MYSFVFMCRQLFQTLFSFPTTLVLPPARLRSGRIVSPSSKYNAIRTRYSKCVLAALAALACKQEC